jgi:hypothetical protein
MKKLLEGKKATMQDVYHLLRFCLMRNTVGPSIAELIEFFGKEESAKRIEQLSIY